ncbi:MAG: Maf family protein, partial [Clostridia bacterium]|nr:Maf family protein [Clostridia bacterium]
HGSEVLDKAGAYGIQSKGALLVDHIDGDYANVVGLPVSMLYEMLKEFGIDIL